MRQRKTTTTEGKEMKKTISMEAWLAGTHERSHAKRKRFKGVTVSTAAELVGKTRVTVWKWIVDGKLDAWRILDAGNREVSVIVTQESLEKVCDLEDEYASQMLIDL